MTVLSVAVGGPKDVVWGGRTIRTSIFKTPVSGRVRVGRTNLAGDAQSNLAVHGGPDKAVYAYPREHYDPWRHELGLAALDWAAFGENLTTAGLLETAVRIGDRIRAGSAQLVVRQPRMPCFKLGLRFGRDDMVARFTAANRSGFYLAVEEEGEVAAGDAIVVADRDPVGLTVAEVYRLKIDGGPSERLALAASHPELSAGWRDAFAAKLAGRDGE